MGIYKQPLPWQLTNFPWKSMVVSDVFPTFASPLKFGTFVRFAEV